ncbi:hypothetical protein [Roseobacter litoralis]|uniref:hypothetical protein n=1 Tax=Roseobacter litoralis TaxID=42443 RepID=UPI002494A8EB|nr:hypothetical protein [Roseobacter litoralis]
MNNLIVHLALLRVVRPIIEIVLKFQIPIGSLVGFVLRTAAVFLLLFYSFIASICLFPPWWARYSLALLHLLLSVRFFRRFHIRPSVNNALKSAELAYEQTCQTNTASKQHEKEYVR